MQTNAAGNASQKVQISTRKEAGQRRGVTMRRCIMESQIAEGKFWLRATRASSWALQVGINVGDLKTEKLGIYKKKNL